MQIVCNYGQYYLYMLAHVSKYDAVAAVLFIVPPSQRGMGTGYTGSPGMGCAGKQSQHQACENSTSV